MAARPVNCNDDQLRQVLAGAGEDTVAVQHVETCSRCQSRLSELAAEPDAWREAHDLLATDDADAQLAAEARERPWSGGTHGAKPTAWTETMAKQLLGP